MRNTQYAFSLMCIYAHAQALNELLLFLNRLVVNGWDMLHWLQQPQFESYCVHVRPKAGQTAAVHKLTLPSKSNEVEVQERYQQSTLIKSKSTHSRGKQPVWHRCIRV